MLSGLDSVLLQIAPWDSGAPPARSVALPSSAPPSSCACALERSSTSTPSAFQPPTRASAAPTRANARRASPAPPAAPSGVACVPRGFSRRDTPVSQGVCLCGPRTRHVDRKCVRIAPDMRLILLLALVAPSGALFAQEALGSTAHNNVYFSGKYSRFTRRRQPSLASGIAPGAACGSDSSCAGYPRAFCDGVCASTVTLGPLTPTSAQSPNEPCQYSQQCDARQRGAFCAGLRCRCVFGMTAGVSGDRCTFANRNCSTKGAIWIDEIGQCKQVIVPGAGPCSHSMQCSAAFPGARCRLQRCECPPEAPNAVDGTCGRNCSEGFTFSAVAGDCIPTVRPGESCSYSVQCHAVLAGTVCLRGHCRCPHGGVFSGTACVAACPAGFMATAEGLCRPGCRQDQIEQAGQCLDRAIPGERCLVSAQCSGGSFCLSGSCRCPLHQRPDSSGACVHGESTRSSGCGGENVTRKKA
uniref:EB domain-containing protein n=1 Tax=Steinernema glaseri TaxID=37863 RepID=A0A1I7XY24_9BILA